MAFAFRLLLEEPLHIAIWWSGFGSLLLTFAHVLHVFIKTPEDMGPSEHRFAMAYVLTYLAFCFAF